MLYNSLGNAYSVLHSRVGPDLTFCETIQCGDQYTTYAVPGFVPGHTGTDYAVTIAPGSYHGDTRVHNVVLTDAAAVVNASQGRISVWFEEQSAPVPYVDGVYRIFNGSYGLDSGFGLWVDGGVRDF